MPVAVENFSSLIAQEMSDACSEESVGVRESGNRDRRVIRQTDGIELEFQRSISTP